MKLYRTIQLPQFKDARYVVIRGEVFINLSADVSARIIRFIGVAIRQDVKGQRV